MFLALAVGSLLLPPLASCAYIAIYRKAGFSWALSMIGLLPLLILLTRIGMLMDLSLGHPVMKLLPYVNVLGSLWWTLPALLLAVLRWPNDQIGVSPEAGGRQNG